MTSGFERFFWQQRELDRVLGDVRRIVEESRRLPQPILDSMAKLSQLRDQFTLPREYLAATSAILEKLNQRPVIESLAFLSSVNSPAVEALQRQQSEIADLMRSLSSARLDIQGALQPMVDSLAATEALLGLKRLDQVSVDVAVQPQLAFQQFAKKQLSLAAAASNIARQNRLALVDSSVHLLDSITRGFELAAIMRPSAEDLWVGPIPRVNVYRTIDHELESLDLEATAIDAECTIEETLSGRSTELGDRLVTLVYNLNRESELEGHPVLFKPTTKTLMACGVIPSRVACDEASFTEIIDHLFFLLYEGSGDAKRLVERREKSRLEALWRLKHLRLGARHDLDHGEKSGVKKKNRQVGDAYTALIGKKVPRRKNEWMAAQVELYRQLTDMLEGIWYGED